MTEEIAEYLLSNTGRELITQAGELLAERQDDLAALTRLRKRASLDEASAAWGMAQARRRGAEKFGPEAAQMYFVGEALEQASSRRAAAYHARRLSEAGIDSVTDICGGIGGDALAFARAGLSVTLVERDPVRARFAEENARVAGRKEKVRVVCADASVYPVNTEAIWFDPARRAGSRRVVAPEDYEPPLSLVRTWQAQGRGSIGIKLSPAIDHNIAKEYGAELEFVSDNGECKEALLWLGSLQSGASVRASLLTDDWQQSLQESHGRRISARTGEELFLYESDPAVIRAHLVQTLGDFLGADPVDPQIAYLVGGKKRFTLFAATYEIQGQFAYSRKRLQDALTQRGIGRVVIKKRGFPLEPDEVRKQLKLTGTNEAIVILTRRGAKHWAFVCQRLSPQEELSRELANGGLGESC